VLIVPIWGLVLATSVDPSDDILAETVEREGVAVFRGPLADVQARFIAALDAYPADHLVRLTGDCPLADPHLIDATIAHVLAYDADYGSNTPPHRTFPKGLDVEVMTAKALREAAESPTDEARQHVTWDLHRGAHRWKQAFLSQAMHEGEERWTVDRPDDSSLDIRTFLRRRPDLATYGGDRRL